MTGDMAKGIIVIHKDFKVYLGQEAHISEGPILAGQIVGQRQMKTYEDIFEGPILAGQIEG